AVFQQHPQPVHAVGHRRPRAHGVPDRRRRAHGHPERPACAAGHDHRASGPHPPAARSRADAGVPGGPGGLGLSAGGGRDRHDGAAGAGHQGRAHHDRGAPRRRRAVAAGVSGAVVGRAAGLLALLILGLLVLARGLTPAAGGLLAFVHLVDLVFHEAGHVIFGIFGRFLGILGGSLNQVLIPAICTGYFVWHRQPAAAAVMLFWVGESVTDVAIYVADGRDMALPLLAEGLIHDWNWILSELSLRNQA